MKKERLDVLLVKKVLASSREKAKAYIMAGQVYVDHCKGKNFKICQSRWIKA